jgi:geranylgeranyl diphosphate synthase type II
MIIEKLEKCAETVTEKLDKYLDLKDTDYKNLTDSMRYSVLSGGKRVRPYLAYAFARALGADTERVWPMACAMEMTHCASLIHDDLPVMDDDDLRRGRPTNHKVFGEATALLAGDALFIYVYQVIADAKELDDKSKVWAISLLSSSAGPCGMVGGQQIDMDSEQGSPSVELLKKLQSLKTGALIYASCALGCIAANKYEDEKIMNACRKYASCIGLAFQIKDDILDVTSTAEVLGKPIGSDAANGKNTFMSHMSVEEAQKLVEDLTKEAVEAVRPIDAYGDLEELALFLSSRES